jgi:hypothetical protein
MSLSSPPSIVQLRNPSSRASFGDARVSNADEFRWRWFRRFGLCSRASGDSQRTDDGRARRRRRSEEGRSSIVLQEVCFWRGERWDEESARGESGEHVDA